MFAQLPFARRAVLAAVAPLLLVGTVACSGGAVDTIDREVFITTYVDLRMAALETDSARIATSDRDEILQRNGVTAEDLTSFAELHAADLDFMRDVWNEVELRMDVDPGAEGDAP